MEVQELLKIFAAHPQVSALDTLLNGNTSNNIFLKGLNGSGAAMTIASLFLKRGGNYVCILGRSRLLLSRPDAADRKQ